MDVYDLSSAAVDSIRRVDLTSLTEPPQSPIGEFHVNDSTGGVGAFVGSPPWECHTHGDELLHVLAGHTELTLIDGDEREERRLGPGALVVVPRGCWHRNNAPDGVTVLYITPVGGNLHSWADDPRTDVAP